MNKVNLFIVGAAKAGTTSLWAGFKHHPQIYTVLDELNKEPAYFSKLRRQGSLNAYQLLYKDGGRYLYRCDASTAYLTSKDAVQNIYAYNPKAKIIIILRNPVDRAYSLYNWMVSDGYEYALNFEHALNLEDKRFLNGPTSFFMPEYFWNYMYFRSGLYSRQIAPYIEKFKDNVLVLNFSDLVNYPSILLKTVYLFLGVEVIDHEIPKENPARSVYSPLLSFGMRKIINQLNKIGVPAETKIKRDWPIYGVTKKKRPDIMMPDTRNVLNLKYEKELKYLATRFGIDLVH
ncbi:MAG: sulfotransferase [Desulfobacterales bacterium]|nr:sulfotransferase [Desulfobacterales bacterium]